MAQQVSSVGFTYEVFLSFRGSDTRYIFTRNLYMALKDKGIHTFMDDRELQGGEEITSSLSYAIENSRIAIIVFSENYAASSFCLDELVKIIDVFNVNDRLILPVFYGVEPTQLRHHTGSYGIAIAKHEKTLQSNTERLQKWKIALNQAADLSGHTFNPTGKEYECEFIGKIVDMVSNYISHIPLHVADCRVGLKSRELKVKSLLNKGSNDGIFMVGIHGIGGIGKTTLAREIYNSIAKEFEGSCFLEDVRKHKLLHLQETLLHEIVRDKDLRLVGVSKGISIIKQRLRKKKVLLILDDVDNLKQLEALVGGCDWFGPGSKVIITTRDQHLLKSHGIEKTYEVEELNEAEAHELLKWTVFKKNNVDSSYDEVLNSVVTYASGLPLALEVVGSNMRGKCIEEWASTLDQYKTGLDKTIQKILQISFDTLEKDEQSVFLDIACCFRGYDLSEIKDILHARYGRCVKHHIRVLVEKSLVKISQGSRRDTEYVTLHDLIVDMGKNIVLQESPKEPGKRSRLWLYEDIVRVLEDNTGTNKIEIICLDCASKDSLVELNGKAFEKMENLKTLIINNCSYNLKSHFSKVLKHFPTSLRVLEWCKYSFKFTQLILLSKRFEYMTVLKFDNTVLLRDIPDVSGIPKLEIFSFRNCPDLIKIHKSVGFLSKLKILDVEGCKKLKNFPSKIKLPSLQVLRLSSTRIKSFPKISKEMKNITQLALKYTRIKKFPSSFQKLTGLCNLTIISKYKLRLSISILMISSLSRVSIEGCRLLALEKDNPGSIAPSNVKVLHLKYCELSDKILLKVLELVPNVEELDLTRSNFTIIPEYIQECRLLTRLSLNYCSRIEEMGGLPPNLKYLDARNFKLPTSFPLESILNQKLHEDGDTGFWFNGRVESIPMWFEHQRNRTPISFWFRKRVPSIALFFHIKLMGEHLIRIGPCMRINGNIHRLRLMEGSVDPELQIFENHDTYVGDVQLQDMRLESELDEALLRNEWIHAQVVFYDDEKDHVMKSKEPLILSGIHVFKKTNMDDMKDIQFTNPYEGYVKVSCAVVFCSESDATACGGILRDHLGLFQCGFYERIGQIDILHAELKAIFYSVQLARKEGYRKIIVESKSRSAIQMLKMEIPPDLSCRYLVREIQIFANSADQVVWSHTSSNENGDAYLYAKACLKLSWKDGLIRF